MAVQTVSPKGAIVIPASLRKKYNIRPASKVEIIDTGTGLLIVPLLEDPIEQLHGFLKHHESLTQALLIERSRDKDKEEKDGELCSG